MSESGGLICAYLLIRRWDYHPHGTRIETSEKEPEVILSTQLSVSSIHQTCNSTHIAPPSAPLTFSQDWARVEAKNSPRKVFEAADWTEWLPGTTRVPCAKGLRKLVSLVLEKGMLDPNPAGRPQTTAALQGLLHQALRLYEAIEAEGKEVGREGVEDSAEQVDVH